MLTYYNYCIDSYSDIPYAVDPQGKIHCVCGAYSGISNATCALVVEVGCRQNPMCGAGGTMNVTDSICITISPTLVAAVHDDVRTLPFIKYVANSLEISCPVTRNCMLEVTDLLGRLIVSKNIDSNSQSYHLSVQDLPPGCYFARLSGGNGASEVVKFVVAP